MRTHVLFNSRLRCSSQLLPRALLLVGLISISFASARAGTYQMPVARGGFVNTPRSYIIDRHIATGEIGAQPPDVRNPWYLGSDGAYISEEVFVFALPALAAGETIDSASFRFYTERWSAITPFVDLYAIAINNSGEPLTEFLDSDIPDAGNIRLQDNLLTPLDSGDVAQVHNTNPSGGSALAAYLSSFYTDNPGYAGGSYVYLRLNPDGTAPGNWRIYLSGISHGSVNDPTEPVLSFTTVPEPSTYALAAVGVVALLAVRRRKSAA